MGAVLVFSFVRPPPPASAPPDAPDLLVVLAAGLRADGTGTTGEAALLEALGRTPSLRCSAAYAQTTSPYRSLGTVLTGRYPSSIPLCGHTGVGLFSTAASRLWCSQIPQDRHDLMGILGAHGYRTRILYLGREAEDRAGEGTFEGVDGGPLAPSLGSPSTLVDDSVGWWRAGDGAPRLLVVVDSTVFDLRHRHLPGNEPPRDRLYAEYAALGGELGARTGELIEAISEPDGRPLWTAFTSLCGLNLAEHTGSDDGYLDTMMQLTVADRTLHVPLLLFAPQPGPQERTLDQVVELVDLLPTVLGRAGIPAPAGLPGEDLWALDEAGDPTADAYAEFGDALALRRGDHMLTFRYPLHNATALDPAMTHALTDLAPLRRDPGTPKYYRLHDVVDDPLQARDLLMDRFETSRELYEALAERRAGPAGPPEGGLDEDQVEALRAFREGGYW